MKNQILKYLTVLLLFITYTKPILMLAADDDDTNPIELKAIEQPSKPTKPQAHSRVQSSTSIEDEVAVAIAAACGLDYSVVANHIIALTGDNGVTSENMTAVFTDPMFGGSSADISSFNTPKKGQHVVIIYHNPEDMDENTWHAVNGYYQHNSSEIICIYKVTGTPCIVSKSMIKAIFSY